MVFKEQLNAHIRFTLKVKVKVIKGHTPALMLCESSSLPSALRAALAVNRVDEAWVNRQTFGKTLNRKPTLYYVRYFPTPITHSSMRSISDLLYTWNLQKNSHIPHSSGIATKIPSIAGPWTDFTVTSPPPLFLGELDAGFLMFLNAVHMRPHINE